MLRLPVTPLYAVARKIDPFISLSFFSGAVMLAFLLLPLLEMIFAPSVKTMAEAASDADVRKAIGLSLGTEVAPENWTRG